MDVILVFDIGKTNKKLLLFNRDFEVVHQEESIFTEVSDEDDFPCDDAHGIEQWILDSIESHMASNTYRPGIWKLQHSPSRKPKTQTADHHVKTIFCQTR